MLKSEAFSTCRQCSLETVKMHLLACIISVCLLLERLYEGKSREENAIKYLEIPTYVQKLSEWISVYFGFLLG